LASDVKRIDSIVTFENDRAELASRIRQHLPHDLALYFASFARSNLISKTQTGRLIDPYKVVKRQDARTEISPSFMAKFFPFWSAASWARTFRNACKNGDLEIVRILGNEVFHRATDKGFNWTIHDMLHALFLLRGIIEKAQNALLLAE